MLVSIQRQSIERLPVKNIVNGMKVYGNILSLCAAEVAEQANVNRDGHVRQGTRPVPNFLLP
jgi:hypothetical protein